MQGYSISNLWRMRSFYIEYQDDTKLAPLVREIGWSHNIVIFEKCKDALEREYYIKMTKQFGWTKAVLIYQIENKNFLLNQTNFDKTIAADYRDQAKLAIKDEYSFDFLEMREEEPNNSRICFKRRKQAHWSSYFIHLHMVSSGYQIYEVVYFSWNYSGLESLIEIDIADI